MEMDLQQAGVGHGHRYARRRGPAHHLHRPRRALAGSLRVGEETVSVLNCHMPMSWSEGDQNVHRRGNGEAWPAHSVPGRRHEHRVAGHPRRLQAHVVARGLGAPWLARLVRGAEFLEMGYAMGGTPAANTSTRLRTVSSTHRRRRGRQPAHRRREVTTALWCACARDAAPFTRAHARTEYLGCAGGGVDPEHMALADGHPG